MESNDELESYVESYDEPTSMAKRVNEPMTVPSQGGSKAKNMLTTLDSHLWDTLFNNLRRIENKVNSTIEDVMAFKKTNATKSETERAPYRYGTPKQDKKKSFK